MVLLCYIIKGGICKVKKWLSGKILLHIRGYKCNLTFYRLDVLFFGE